MRLSRIIAVATKSAKTLAGMSGRMIWSSRVSSKRKTMAVNVARMDAPNAAAMATSAKAPGDTWADGQTCCVRLPAGPPNPPLMSSSGASVPPEVPDASDTHQAASLATTRIESVPRASFPASTALISS